MAKKTISIAKITRPAVTGIYSRTRLFKLLDFGKRRPVTWISGPAGSGKTMLAASWLEARRRPCIWYRLDEGDSDIATFFYYMGLAAAAAAPRYKKPLPLLAPEYLAGIPVFTLRYFENLFSRLSAPAGFEIVLDNYQDVIADSKLHEVISAGMSILPDNVHALILSRSEPPAALAKLQAAGQVYRIGWPDLRFSLEESKAVFKMKKRKNPSNESLRFLHSKTDGWAAGLVLFLESSRISDFDFHKLDAVASDDIFNYFANEIMNKIDLVTQEFLMKTSLLPSISENAAERITGISSASEILSRLCRQNYFTEKHVHSSPVYYYHPIFREFLLSRARASYSHEEIASLRSKSAAVLSETGQIEDAASLFIASQDWNGLIPLILGNAQSMATQGRSRTLQDWIESIPESIFANMPWLIFWKGNCLIPFDPSKSIQLFKQAFEKFKKNNDAMGIFLSWCAAVDVSLHAGEFRFLDSWISQIESVLQSGATIPAKEIDEHFTMSMFIAFSFGRLAHPDMQLCSERAFSLFQSTSDPNVCLQTGVYLVVHDLWKGDNARASIVIDVLLQMARSKKTSDLVTILINATETLYLLFTAACDASVKKVLDTLDFADQTGVHIWDAHLLCNGLAAALSTGNLNQIEILNKRLEACLPNAKRFDLCYKYILSSWNYIIQNRLDLAYQNAELAAGMIPEIGFEPAEPAPHIAKALFLQKLGKNEESAHSFSEAWTIISRIKSYQLEFMYSLFRSKSEFDLKNDKEAMQLLHRAMSLGKQYKLYNSYWWHGAMMSELSVRALEANIETDYVQELIRKRNLIPENPPIHVENWPWPVKIKTLGRFEIYVEGEALVFSGKAQKKPMEMLKAIISLGGKDIPEEQLEDLLWPDSDGDAAHNAFTTTLSRLRNILGRSEAIQMSDGKVTLDPRLCWMDVWAFVHSIKQFESALRSQSSSSVHAILDRIFDLYQGGFLPADTHVAWTTSIRERLRSQFLRVLGEAANSGERARQWSEATELCRRFLEIDHLSEEIYQRLIRCQIQLGLHAEAIAAYNQCEKALREAFGISPSEKTKSLHRSILAAK